MKDVTPIHWTVADSPDVLMAFCFVVFIGTPWLFTILTFGFWSFHRNVTEQQFLFFCTDSRFCSISLKAFVNSNSLVMFPCTPVSLEVFYRNWLFSQTSKAKPECLKLSFYACVGFAVKFTWFILWFALFKEFLTTGPFIFYLQVPYFIHTWSILYNTEWIMNYILTNEISSCFVHVHRHHFQMIWWDISLLIQGLISLMSITY